MISPPWVFITCCLIHVLVLIAVMTIIIRVVNKVNLAVVRVVVIGSVTPILVTKLVSKGTILCIVVVVVLVIILVSCVGISIWGADLKAVSSSPTAISFVVAIAIRIALREFGVAAFLLKLVLLGLRTLGEIIFASVIIKYNGFICNLK